MNFLISLIAGYLILGFGFYLITKESYYEVIEKHKHISYFFFCLLGFPILIHYLINTKGHLPEEDLIYMPAELEELKILKSTGLMSKKQEDKIINLFKQGGVMVSVTVQVETDKVLDVNTAGKVSNSNKFFK